LKRKAILQAVWRSVVAMSMVAVVSLLRWALSPWLGGVTGLTLFIPAVMVATWYGGVGLGFAAMILAALAGESTVSHPAGIFDPRNHESVRIFLFLLVGTQIAVGTELLHWRTRQAHAANHAKDYFIRMLSHELRTPLTPALTAANLLAGDATLPDAVRQEVELIQRNLALEVRLIDDLLDISRIQSHKLQLTRAVILLEPILEQAVETCRAGLTAKHLHLRTHTQGGPYRVNADPVRLLQIFWNLLRNAIKFTPDSGTISINVTADGPDQVAVQITDTGIGIAPRILPHIFEAFEQGDAAITRQFGGLGLGLAITRTLVVLHGGRIDAASAGPGRGAAFIVRLPVSAFPLTRTVTPRLPLSAAPAVALKILIVDDHPDTLRVMTRLLERLGHEVQAAGSCAAAHAGLDSQEVFDLLLTDLDLPDGTGLDLGRQLLARKRVRHAIALSGYGTDEDRRQTRAAGFTAHLLKPVAIADLQEALAALPSHRKA